MIYGDIPWEEDDDIIQCRLIKKTCNYSFNSDSDTNFQSDVFDLIKKCLNVNDSERIKLDEILNHKWLKPEETNNNNEQVKDENEHDEVEASCSLLSIATNETVIKPIPEVIKIDKNI